MATIYLIHATDTNVYKIGYTMGDVNKRLKKLQTGSFTNLVFADLIKLPENGDAELPEMDDPTQIPKAFEKAFHVNLSSYKHQGEWFILDSLDPYYAVKQSIFGDDWEGIRKYINRINEREDKQELQKRVDHQAAKDGLYLHLIDRRWVWQDLEEQAYNYYLKAARAKSASKRLAPARKSGELYRALRDWFYSRDWKDECDSSSLKQKDWKRYIEEDCSQKFNYKLNLGKVNDYILVFKYYRAAKDAYQYSSWDYDLMLERVKKMSRDYSTISEEIERVNRDILFCNTTYNE